MTKRLITVALICNFSFSLVKAEDNGEPSDIGAVRRTTSQPSSGQTTDRIEELTRMLLDQQRQIDQLRRALDAKKAAEEHPAMQENRTLGEVASTAAVGPVSTAASAVPAMTAGSQDSLKPSPLSLSIGSAYITPLGFMDFTGVYRDTSPGSGIGTNFGSFPYRNGSNVPGQLGEFRLSTQNSRIGARIDTIVNGAKVLAYWESDFLGSLPANAAVSSNSDTFRLRLYWVDVRKSKFELLGGQSWSMITPGRKGISPIPGDLFYTQDIDVNYQAGLPWGRVPQFRMIFHAKDWMAAGVSFEAAEQYIGGSGGGGTVVLPSAIATAYANQEDNGNTTLSVPNVHPDIITKFAIDPKLRNGHGLHFEVAGIERTFKTYNPVSGRHFSAAGGSLQANLHYELAKGLRLLTNNYWSDGGGRYLFGLAPDLVVRGDGSVSLIHASSTLSGIEFTRLNTLLYAYYGGVVIGRNSVIDPSTHQQVGYGYPGSVNGQNRTVQEG